MICQIRAARASFGPARSEHEVIDDQLAAAIKRSASFLFAIRPVKHIFLLDFFPRQFTALQTAKLIALTA